METRTSFKIMNDGTIKCFCGNIKEFARDICDFVQPILNYLIEVEFNNINFIVTTHDTVDTICKKYKYELERMEY
jgi:hypothetical protein